MGSMAFPPSIYPILSILKDLVRVRVEDRKLFPAFSDKCWESFEKKKNNFYLLSFTAPLPVCKDLQPYAVILFKLQCYHKI